MEFRLDLPFAVPDEIREEIKVATDAALVAGKPAPRSWMSEDRTITLELCRRALQAKFEKGVKKSSGSDQRVIGRIQKKFTLAGNGKSLAVDLDGVEFRMLRDCLAELVTPPQADIYSWLTELDDHVKLKERELEVAEALKPEPKKEKAT